MTVTLERESSLATEVTLEYEKSGCYYARVYESCGGEWHKTHESNPYREKAKSLVSYKRFVKRYIK